MSGRWILFMTSWRPAKSSAILTIVDTHSRDSPATDPRFAYRGEDLVQTLERVCAQIGYPA